LTLLDAICCSCDTTLNPAAPNPSAATLAQLFEPIRGDLREVEREFERHVQSQVSVIPAIGSYIRDGGGKRIRPAVLLMAARMAGAPSNDPRAVSYASVLEFIHTATLVHDDIIDEADLRRGREAVHTRYGNHITVLFGDFLYLKSMSLALSHDELEIVRLLCDVTLRIVEGEIYQLTKTGVVDLAEEEHFDIVRRKTALLFAGSARIGGMLGTATREQQEALWDYGVNIGMAFQIVDDLLDVTATDEALGKPAGHDLVEGTYTLPIIRTLAAGGSAADELSALLARLRPLDGSLEPVDDPQAITEARELLVTAPAVRSALDTARGFVEEGRRALAPYAGSEATTALEAASEHLLGTVDAAA
jgi:octaprenyl-diphosphate synthase